MSPSRRDHPAHDDMTRTQLAAIVASCAEAIIAVTLDGEIAVWNAAAKRLYGYAEAEILGRPLRTLAPSERQAEIDALLARARAGEPMPSLEAVLRHKDGRLIDVAATIFPVTDEDGHLIAISAIVQDITARKAANAALAAQEARFRSLINQATDIITILTAEGIVRYQSPPIKRILGWEPEDLLGRNAFELVHTDDRQATWNAYEAAIIDPTLMPTVEFRFQHHDGSWRWLEATGTNLLAEPTVGGFVVNSRDITERKQLEQQLRTALEAAQAGLRAKGHFLAVMSHELRTPLQAIQGYTEFLLSAPHNSLTDEQREDLSTIHRSAGRMAALIGNLLDLSRLEAGRLTLAHDAFDLREILEQVRQDVAPQAAAKALALDMEVPQQLSALHGDAARVRQILLNLVGNAVKFTHRGGVHISVSCVLGTVAIAVEDSGVGIMPESLPQIFDEFRQVDSKRSLPGGGAGLGLAISRQLAELMGGTISVQSEPGVGSTFTLHLPVTQEATPS